MDLSLAFFLQQVTSSPVLAVTVLFGLTARPHWA